MNCPLARCTQRARKSGFTLVELMVAIVILTIGMLALAGTTAVMAQMVGTGARQTLAANVAQSRFEIMRRTSCATLTAGSGTTRGISEAWQVDSIRGGAYLRVSVSYATRAGTKTQQYRSVRPC